MNFNRLSCHLHGGLLLILEEDISRIFKNLFIFFSYVGSTVDGNCLLMGFRNQLSGNSERMERSGNISFLFLIEVLVSLYIGTFCYHIDDYVYYLYLKDKEQCHNLF